MLINCLKHNKNIDICNEKKYIQCKCNEKKITNLYKDWTLFLCQKCFNNLIDNVIIVPDIISNCYDKNYLKKEIYYHLSEVKLLFDDYILNETGRIVLENEMIDLFILLKIKIEKEYKFSSKLDTRFIRFIENIKGEN